MRAEKRNKDTKNEVKISSRVFVYLCLAGLAIAVVTGWLMFVQGFFPLRVRADGMDANKPRTKSEKKATETIHTFTQTNAVYGEGFKTNEYKKFTLPKKDKKDE